MMMLPLESAHHNARRQQQQPTHKELQQAMHVYGCIIYAVIKSNGIIRETRHNNGTTYDTGRYI